MWELFLEVDYNTIRNAVWAGWFLAIMLPMTAIYFFNEGNSFSFHRKEAIIRIHSGKPSGIPFLFMEWNGIIRFLSYIRRKQAPDDSDEPSILFVC
ncbi:hypothetical protein ELQ35_07650 [Peribacillus cavernae]|uniref:Uncharacterized protein n=1 Tax=Peribacillus cavernae TaxID=1674310 RepID=A0A433HPH3_9BACI|nr:hypothetical protein [Peribacillus cavernae]MDQ0217335.1 hypothetical protein [Peribacillus cavernae]RUQ30209.1 hypothetical protein ELQ35_07650 [Peribacillus cavernae]